MSHRSIFKRQRATKEARFDVALGKRLRQLRNSKWIFPVDFAWDLGSSVWRIRRIECGDMPMTTKELRGYCEALAMTKEEILKGLE